jgi:oxidase EvaA
MRLQTVEDALAIRERIAQGLRVREIAAPARDWVLRDGRLVNTRAAYFEVIGRRSPTGEHLLLRQNETALVGLVITGPRGRRRLLLNARAEPGLVGACQFSTTVQSTPANYERRHGGRATPYLDTVLTPDASARTLVDCLQYDWGQYYHLKAKRFVIVELPAESPANPPLYWVDSGVSDALLAGDHLATADLHVAAGALALHDRGLEPEPAPPALEVDGDTADPTDHTMTDVALDAATEWSINDRGVSRHDGTRHIVLVRTTADTREVDDWDQPLMAVTTPLEIALALRDTPAGWEAAVVRETREGLDGRRILYPAPQSGGRIVYSSEISAEGGRFLRHRVALRVVVEAEVAPEAAWVPLDTLGRLALSPLMTSVELRLVLGSALHAGSAALTEAAR